MEAIKTKHISLKDGVTPSFSLSFAATLWKKKKQISKFFQIPDRQTEGHVFFV